MNAPIIPTATPFLSPPQHDLLRRTILAESSDDEAATFFATAERLRLDPFARHIYAVRRWDARLRREVQSIQVSIDGMRAVAARTGEYEGQIAPAWCARDGAWRDAWLIAEPPAAARCGVWRRGFREPLIAVARYDAYVARSKDGAPSRMWATMPDVMVAKVAEALALRRAFPAELAGVYTGEEMAQAQPPPPPIDRVTESPPAAEHQPIDGAVAALLRVASPGELLVWARDNALELRDASAAAKREISAVVTRACQTMGSDPAPVWAALRGEAP